MKIFIGFLLTFFISSQAHAVTLQQDEQNMKERCAELTVLDMVELKKEVLRAQETIDTLEINSEEKEKLKRAWNNIYLICSSSR